MDSVIGSHTTLEARGSVGVFALLAANPNNDGSTAYRDVATSVVSGGDFHAAGDNRRDLNQFKLDVSHFRDNWVEARTASRPDSRSR